MVRLLTTEEKKRVRQVLAGEQPPEILETPEELHQLAWHWNWDDGVEVPVWIIQQPHCDRGTAALIYWYATPGWHRQFANRDEVIAHRADVAVYDLLTEIEVKCASRFYTYQDISFDPHNDNGYDWTHEYRDGGWEQSIPEMMLHPTPGDTATREDLHDIIIRSLTQVEQAVLDDHIVQAFNLLQHRDPSLTRDSEPEKIIDGIVQEVDTYRTTLSFTDQINRSEPICDLGWVWADQLTRSYGWRWQCWEANGEEAHLAVFSPNNLYVSFPPNIVVSTVNSHRVPNRIRDVFDLLGSVTDTRQLQEAYAHGEVMLNPYVL